MFCGGMMRKFMKGGINTLIKNNARSGSKTALVTNPTNLRK